MHKTIEKTQVIPYNFRQKEIQRGVRNETGDKSEHGSCFKR